MISLYDYTTIFVQPWADAGYTCYCVDIQHPKGLTIEGNIVKVGMDVREFVDLWTSQKEEVSFLAAFPPCTDLAVSGAAHFKSKLEKNPNYRAEAMELVYLADRFGTSLGCPYFIENPVSVISSE